jgi:hypothetical protein
VSEVADLETQLSRLEDKSAILRLLKAYGPAAVAGPSSLMQG